MSKVGHKDKPLESPPNEGAPRTQKPSIDAPLAGASSVGAPDEDPCQNPDSMQILREFNQIFADRLERIDQHADGSECVEKKYPIYREWVECLIDQNSDLIEAVDAIEREACNRLRHLEERFSRQSNQIGLAQYKSDIANLVEYIRRARDDGSWNSEGLNFYHVKPADLLGTSHPESEREIRRMNFEKETPHAMEFNELIDPVSLIDQRNFESIISELKSINTEQLANIQTVVDENRDLKLKCEQLEKTLQMRTKRVSEDTRALVLEVAERHDTICKFRNDINKLEGQLEQKDLHIQFKDNIIRDLRRECKKSSCYLNHSHNMAVDHSSESTASESTVKSQIHSNIPYSINDSSRGDEMQKEDSSSVTILQHEWDQMKHNLEQRANALHERDTTIAEQNRQLDLLNSMRSLVNSFRTVLEQLQGFEHFQPNQTGLSSALQNISNSSSTVSGEMTSGFYSAETLCASTSFPNPPPSTVNTQMSGDAGQPITECDDGSVLVNGIQTVMQKMCAQIVDLNKDNAQLNVDIMCLKEERVAQDDHKDVEAAKLRGALVEVAKILSRLTDQSLERVPVTDPKRLDDESLDAIASGDVKKIADLADRLMSNLVAKDQQLDDQNARIRTLEADIKRFERELFESHKRGSTMLNQEREQHMKTIENLNKAVAVHKDSVEKLQAAKLGQDNQLQELHRLISTLQKTDQTRLDKQLKLENELRDGDGYYCSDLQLQLHDATDITSVSILSEQLSVYFDENLNQQLYIQHLLDDNLALRAQLGTYMQDTHVDRNRGSGRSSASNVNEIYDTNYEDLWQSASSCTSGESNTSTDQQKPINQTKPKPINDQFTQLLQSKSMNDRMVEDISGKLRTLLTMAAENKRQHLNGMQLIERTNLDLRQEIAMRDDRLRSNELLNMQLQHKMDNQRREIGELQGLNSELELKLKSTAIQKIDADKASSQIKHLENQIKGLINQRRKVDEMQRFERNKIDDALARLKLENDVLIKENSKMKQDLNQVTSERTAMTNILDQYRTQVQNAVQIEQRLSSELSQNTDSVCTITAENTRLKMELDELRAKQEATQTTYTELHTKMVNDWTDLRTRAENRQITIRLNEQTIDTITEANEQLIKRIGILESDITTLRDTIAGLRERLTNISDRESVMVKTSQDDMAKIKQDVQRFHGLLTDLYRELMDSNSSNQKLSKTHEESSRELNQLQQEYEDLQNDYKDLKEIKEEAVGTLETTKCLLLEQREREQKCNLKLTKQSEHIETLLYDRKILMLKVQQLQRDLLLQPRSDQYLDDGSPENDTSARPVPAAANTQRVYHSSDNPSNNRTLYYPARELSSESIEIETHKRMEEMVQTVRKKRLYIGVTLATAQQDSGTG